MQNTRAIGRGETLKINPKNPCTCARWLLGPWWKTWLPCHLASSEILLQIYRSIDLHLQFLSILLQPLYQFGQWNSTVLLLVFIPSCFGFNSQNGKEKLDINQVKMHHSSPNNCANWTTFVAVNCSIRVPGCLDSNCVFDKNSINWIDWLKYCNYGKQAKPLLPPFIICAIIWCCFAVYLSKQ